MVHTHCCEVSFCEDMGIYLSILLLMDIWEVSSVWLWSSAACVSSGEHISALLLGTFLGVEPLGHRCEYVQLE